MWNEPTLEKLSQLPELYSTENTPAKDTVIGMHFFLGGSDWYVAEYDRSDQLFYGFAILNNDLDNAEWGYVSFEELRKVNVQGIEVDRDLHWQPRVAGNVEKIAQTYERKGGW